MFSKNLYVVATTDNVHDVNIVNIYDADVFNLDSILAGLRKRLKDLNVQVAIAGKEAYIDVLDDNDELVKTYSIILKKAFVKKHNL